MAEAGDRLSWGPEVSGHGLTPSLRFHAGVVPEQKIQRATDETAERSRGPAARLLPGSEEDEDPGGATGRSRHSGTRRLRLLRR